MLTIFDVRKSIVDLANEIANSNNGGKLGLLYLKIDNYKIYTSDDYAEILGVPGNGAIIKIIAEKIKS